MPIEQVTLYQSEGKFFMKFISAHESQDIKLWNIFWSVIYTTSYIRVGTVPPYSKLKRGGNNSDLEAG